MRFRLKPIAFTLLCTFAHPAGANADLLALRMDKTFRAMAAPTQETPAFIEADHLTGKKESQIEATGNAILRKRGQSIRADRLLYFQDTQDLDAQGSVVLEQDGNTMSGPHLKLNLDTSIGFMEQPVFYLVENDGRGSADMLHIHDKQHYTLDNATYTTCPADNQDWLLNMHGLEIDRDRQIGTAHHAWVEFMGLPILYSPWMDFPLNDQRKSGFLSPVFGNTTNSGREFTLPYYWNIAPNRDATIAPRVMTKRGVLLNNEFRYLEPSYSGELQADVLPSDALAKRSRTHIALIHNQAIAGALNGYVNLNSVSDDAYFRDLGSTVNATSQANLLQEGVLSYSAGWWNAAARVQRYQTLQDPAAPIGAPYKRLPQLTVNAQQNYSGANAAFAGEFVDFAHPVSENAQRLVLNPSVSYPLVSDAAFYLTPKVALHSTYYAMGANNTRAYSSSSRTLPLYSVDGGIAFERDWNLFGSGYLHTLEPRAFYVYVPYKDQNQLPNFDTGQAGFDFTQMFSENRFYGNDRVGDANHITLALTSRLLEQDNGTERLKLMIGERFSFKTPQVNFVTPTTTTNKSDILLAASGQVTRAWSFDSEFQYDPNQSQSQRYNIAARYRPELGKSLDLGYRFARNTLRQIDLSGQWPLSSRWRAMGRLNYSLQDGKTLESIAGLEYNQSCWALRFVAQRITVAAQQANTGIFLQLELNDFVSVGLDPIAVLKQNVPSYTKLNEKPANKPSSVLR
ncbi:MAG: organic solvent tolerance protein [Gallionellales bacterium RIFCSPLOWO2_02_60_31]|nr:MAG: organic solvent tolerance protein [Gallionellales bacterium RIFCSPLOWO2_02_60_31]